MSRPRDLVRPATEHLLGLCLAGLAAAPWLAVTGPETGLAHLGGAVAGATALSLAATRARRVSVAAELLLSGAGLAVLLLLVVGDPLGGSEVLRGLRDGVPRILSTGLPLLDVPWAGVPGTIVVWCTAGAIASTIARTRSVARPLLAALLCFLAGYAATLGGRAGDVMGTVTTEALLLALCAGAFALLRGHRAVPEQDRSLLLLRLSGSALTVVIAVGIGAVASGYGPFVAEEPVRPRLAPAATELEPEGPLLVTRRLRTDEPDRVVGNVTVTGDWSGYVPIAVLDHYDGRVWGRTSDELLPTGGKLPVTFPVAGGPTATIGDLEPAATGGWLPYLGRVETIEGVSVLHDAGEVFRLAEPATRTTYRVRAAQPLRALADEDVEDEGSSARSSGLVRPLDVVRRPTENRSPGERVCRLLALTEGGDAPAGADLTVSGAPCGRRAPDRVAFIRSLAAELKDGRAVEVTADDGASAGGPESLADLLELVGPPSAEGASTGAPEQFAAAFVLVADHYGFPVRLVTGFRLEEPVAGQPQQLRGQDAWTWAEVAVEEVGWVAVDPSPRAEDVTDPDELERPELLEEPDARPEEAPAELGIEPEPVVVGPPPPREESGRPPLPVLLGAGLVALVLLPLLLANARRAARRWRRRHRGDARAQVVGAWHELLDVAHDVDVPDVESRTTDDLVAALSARCPELTGDLRTVGSLVDRAVFSSRPVDDGEAAAAWTTVRGARRCLRRSLRPRSRLAAWWRVAPRSVTSGRRRSRRGGGRSGDGGRRDPRSLPTDQLEELLARR